MGAGAHSKKAGDFLEILFFGLLVFIILVVYGNFSFDD